MAEKKIKKKVLFVCDKKKCVKCNLQFNGKPCMHTSDINHAVNFKNNGNGVYEEDATYLNDQEFCITKLQNINDDLNKQLQKIIKHQKEFDAVLAKNGLMTNENINLLHMEIEKGISKNV